MDCDLSELLSKIIHLLPEPEQEVVQLTFFEGLSQRQIAAEKCIAPGHSQNPVTIGSQKTVELFGADPG